MMLLQFDIYRLAAEVEEGFVVVSASTCGSEFMLLTSLWLSPLLIVRNRPNHLVFRMLSVQGESGSPSRNKQ